MSSVPVIIVRGNFAEGNFGDDALLLAVIALLEPHFPLGQIRFECPKLAYRQGSAQDAILAGPHDLKRAVGIIYGGGTQFFSFGNGAVTAPHILQRLLGIARDPTRIMRRLQARRRLCMEAGVPKFGVGLGFGPFVATSTEEHNAQILAANMQFLWVRDRASEIFCSNAGIERVSSGSDLCFLPAFQNQHLGNTQPARSNAAQQIGIILRDWEHGADRAPCIKTCLEFAAICRRDGVKVLFYVFSTQDFSVKEQLLKAGEDAICWEPETMRIADYVAQIGACDMMVTSRFHGAIFSLLLGKPFIAIEIEPKLRMVAEMYGVENALIEPKMPAETLYTKARIILDNINEYGEQACRVRDEQMKLAVCAQAEFDASMRSC